MGKAPDINIGFLLVDHMLATSCTLPMEMLKAAATHATHLYPDDCRQLQLQTLSGDGKAVQTQTGFRLLPERALDSTPLDYIFIPGLWRNPRPILRKAQSTIDWIAQQHEQGATIAAVGTGCCFLAESGLLDHRAATTHWHYFDQFQRNYPKVNLKRQYFITQAGSLYCAGSVNSLADLTIHFIQRIYGRQIAQSVERHFSHEIRQAYENKAYFENSLNAHPDETIVQVELWLQNNFNKAITTQDLANRFDLTLRTLNRRFKNATGKTPLNYLIEKRIQSARELLQNTNLSISEISEKIGLDDPSYFSTLFKKNIGTSPLEYRNTVRKKLFHAE